MHNRSKNGAGRGASPSWLANLMGGPIRSLQKLWKLIGYFEKSFWSVPSLKYIIPGKQVRLLSLSLSPPPPPTLGDPHSPHSFMPSLSCLGTHNYVGLVALWACSRLCGLQRTTLQYETETLETSLCFGLAEDMVGIFPRQDRGRWEIGNPGTVFPRKLCHTTVSCVWFLGILSLQSCGRTQFP